MFCAGGGVDGVGEPGLFCELLCHLLVLLGVLLRLEQEGLGWCGPAEGHGGEEAFALEAECNVDVHLGDGY